MCYIVSKKALLCRFPDTHQGLLTMGCLSSIFQEISITMCVSSCSLAVSGSPPVGLDAESWVSILVSSKRKSSISLWKPWAFCEKTLGTSVVNPSFKSKHFKSQYEDLYRYLLILGRERKIHPIMYALVDFCMCPDCGLNPKCWGIGTTL